MDPLTLYLLKDRLNTEYVPHVFHIEIQEFTQDDEYATDEEIYLVELYQKFCEMLPYMSFNIEEIF